MAPAVSAALVALFVAGEGINGIPVNTTVTNAVVLTPPTGLDAIDEPTMTPRFFLPLISR